jgi:type IV pilus assembly protein PilA
MNNTKNKRLNNGGFSLVELIIVIAIMAVLIGVLAPQYLKYVERSRNATDQDNAAAIESALQVWAAETDSGSTLYEAGKNALVTVNSSKGEVTGDNATAASQALTSGGITIANVKCSSKTKWTSYTVALSVDANGTVSTTVTYYNSVGGTVTP